MWACGVPLFVCEYSGRTVRWLCNLLMYNDMGNCVKLTGANFASLGCGFAWLADFSDLNEWQKVRAAVDTVSVFRNLPSQTSSDLYSEILSIAHSMKRPLVEVALERMGWPYPLCPSRDELIRFGGSLSDCEWAKSFCEAQMILDTPPGLFYFSVCSCPRPEPPLLVEYVTLHMFADEQQGYLPSFFDGSQIVLRLPNGRWDYAFAWTRGLFAARGAIVRNNHATFIMQTPVDAEEAFVITTDPEVIARIHRRRFYVLGGEALLKNGRKDGSERT